MLPPHTSLAQAEFLAAYRTALVEEVARSAPPVYTGPASVPSARLSLLKRKPLGAQALAILAAACGIRGQRPSTHVAGSATDPANTPGRPRSQGLGLVFEMGTGKTYCSLAALAMADEDVTRVRTPSDQRPEKASFFPAIVLCPPIMQEKWAREADLTLPTPRVVILRPITTRDEAAALRRFDPTFRGGKLSAIGVTERIVTRIQQELTAWRAACAHARTQGKRPPAKPCHVVVISQSTAKFGMPWTPVYVLRVLRDQDPETGAVRAQRDPETSEMVTVPCCPSCYTPVAEDERHAAARERRAKRRTKTATTGTRGVQGQGDTATIEGDDDDLDGSGEELPYLSEADLLGETGPRVKRTCAACGEALWQSVPEGTTWRATPPPMDGTLRVRPPLPIPTRAVHPPTLRSTATRRYPIADYLRKRHRGLFRALIADEAHQLKGAGTAQGFAAASLVDACEPGGSVLFLTGTLFSGYSSDLFPMLWRLMPALRDRFGYDEVARWVRLYGVRQKTVKIDVTPGATGGTRSKRKDDPPRFRELPGISPLVLNLLLPHCLFLELADVAPDLPDYSEDVVTVPFGPEIEPIYAAFQREATDTLKAQLRVGDNSGTSSWFHGLMIWPNLPCAEVVARSKRTGVVLGSAPALPADVVYPKERALLDLVRRERAEGRRVLIYVEHTGEHDLLPRLTHLIEEDDARWQAEDPDDHPGAAVRVVTMRGERVAAVEREAWLAKQVTAGCDVLLCHSGLVEVGLDLLAFPTILVYEVIFSTTRWRQAIRRSWRPGQTQPVRVIQLAYERTMEARGLQLIATKAISSLMVEGKMPSQGLAAHAENSSTTNLIMELFEQVVADQEDGQESAIVASVKHTFLELNKVEQEAERYIGDVELPPVDEDEEVGEGEDEQGAEEASRLAMLAPIPRAADQPNQMLNPPPIEPLLAGSQLVVTSLFDGIEVAAVAPSRSSSAIPDAAQSSVEAAQQTEALAVAPTAGGEGHPTQHRYTWDEMRAQLLAEAEQRKAARAAKATGAKRTTRSSRNAPAPACTEAVGAHPEVVSASPETLWDRREDTRHPAVYPTLIGETNVELHQGEEAAFSGDTVLPLENRSPEASHGNGASIVSHALCPPDPERSGVRGNEPVASSPSQPSLFD